MRQWEGSHTTHELHRDASIPLLKNSGFAVLCLNINMHSRPAVSSDCGYSYVGVPEESHSTPQELPFQFTFCVSHMSI